ncbi:hypothetical protein [Aneurinibacillus migulanus]|uniref:hypothetical protein n=1 Tax=Aneurinibacillus migulanus TaxID=47500 RepID=UPI000B00C996|nr:hypothetical protein [Aneurinibacillus migulanus]MED0896316.1 hypothetical protein [Aneurinibacillus migulanus]MED1615095.1 hypothetical protein [Aneurinibacillus migulanus]
MEKEEGGYALRPGRKRRTCLFPTSDFFLLFLPLTTKVCRFIKSDVYSFGPGKLLL